MLNIHDIKAPVEVPDYSFYIFIALIIFAVVFAIVIIYSIYKLFKKDNTLEKKYYKELRDLDFIDAKKEAYLISKYIRVLAKNEREKRLASELQYLLKDYKYKKEIEPLSNEIKAKLDVFLDALNV